MDAARELQFLQRLARAAASTLDAGELVRLVIAETTVAAKTDVCSIYLLEPDGEHLLLSATNGLSQAGVGRVRLRVGEGVTGAAAAGRAPVVVPDVRAEPRFRWLPGVDQARFVSMCSVPIVSSDRLVGALNVQTDAPRHFGASDVALLSAIAAQVAGVLERSELQTRLEARIAALRRSEEIHRRFTELSLAGAGLAAICAAVERHAAAPVAVYDEDGHPLAAGLAPGLPSPLGGFADPARRDDDLTVVPVRAGRDLLGWLAVGPDDGAGGPARRLALEHGVTVLALELMREQAAAEAERRLRGDLLEELLAVPLPRADAELLAQRAARLGYRIQGPVWVAVIEPDGPEAARLLSAATPRRRAARALADVVALDERGLVVERAGGFVLLISGAPSLPEVERLARRALDGVAQAAGGLPASCGIASGPGGPADLHRLAEEARHALRVARRRGAGGAVAAYGRLGVDRLLLEVERPERLAAFVEEWIGTLMRQEEGGKAAAPLVETLAALAAEGWNLRAAARRLSVHVNTLLYRTQRIAQLTGRDLDDQEVRLGFAMALRAHALAGGLDPPHEPEPGSVGRTVRTPAGEAPLASAG